MNQPTSLAKAKQCVQDYIVAAFERNKQGIRQDLNRPHRLVGNHRQMKERFFTRESEYDDDIYSFSDPPPYIPGLEGIVSTTVISENRIDVETLYRRPSLGNVRHAEGIIHRLINGL